MNTVSYGLTRSRDYQTFRIDFTLDCGADPVGAFRLIKALAMIAAGEGNPLSRADAEMLAQRHYAKSWAALTGDVPCKGES
jgi:hypothetical protein